MQHSPRTQAFRALIGICGGMFLAKARNALLLTSDAYSFVILGKRYTEWMILTEVLHKLLLTECEAGTFAGIFAQRGRDPRRSHYDVSHEPPISISVLAVDLLPFTATGFRRSPQALIAPAE